MKPEILTALTTAAGIALDGSRGATQRELADRSHWFTPGSGAENGKVRWCSSKTTASSKPNEWSLAEAGMACGGMEEKYFLALRYTHALDDTALHPLRRRLLEFAKVRQRIERWPALIPTLDGTKPYLQDLVDMALLEDRAPFRFRRTDTQGRPVNMCRVIMNVEHKTWYRKLEPIYEAIVQEYRDWLGVGISHMRRALRNDA